MVATNLNQGFPSINTPFVDLDQNSPRYGMMNQAWYQLLIALWNRTGQGGGSSPQEAMILALAQGADESCDQLFATAFDVGGAEEPPAPPDEAVLMSLAFADDTSGTLDQNAVFPSGITVYGGAAIFNGEAISGGLYIVDTGINIHAGGETVHGGLAAFGGAAISGGLIVTDTGLNVQAGGETVNGGLVVFNGAAVANGFIVTSGGANITGRVDIAGNTYTPSTVFAGGVSSLFYGGEMSTVNLNYTGALNNISDPELKMGLQPLPSVLTIISKIQPIAFVWDGSQPWMDSSLHWGFNAVEVNEVISEALGQPWPGHGMVDGHHTVDMVQLVPVLWQAVKELVAR